jgi:hypothetical protein
LSPWQSRPPHGLPRRFAPENDGVPFTFAMPSRCDRPAIRRRQFIGLESAYHRRIDSRRRPDYAKIDNRFPIPLPAPRPVPGSSAPSIC